MPVRRLALAAAIAWMAGMQPAPQARDVVPAPDRYFVAVDGRDSWTGSLPAPNAAGTDGPFATPAGACRALRGKPGDKTLYVRGGCYFLEEPLRLGPEDSGLRLEAYPGEKPVFSGGKRIDGWRRGDGKLWTAQAPKSLLGKDPFRQLYVNGTRAIRARTPNADSTAPYVQIAGREISPDGKTIKVGFRPGQVKAWRSLVDVELVVLGHWEINRKRLQSVDEAAGWVELAPPHPAFPDRYPAGLRPKEGLSCYFENALEMLDQPGEWYLDRETGLLSYWPREGEEMSSAQVVAPALTRLVELRGTTGKPVRNVHLKGICFSHADWPLPEEGYFGTQACFSKSKPGRIGAAIEWEFAESCSLEDGRIDHAGGSGLALRQGCSGNIVQGNEIRDIGANGLMIGERDDPADPAACVRGNRLADNHIHDCGTDYYGAVGIWVGFAEGTDVSHNRVHDLPYTGVSVGWRWDSKPSGCKSNTIEYNHIHDVMKVLADGGGIYMLGFQPGTQIRGNLIHDIHRSPFALGSPNNGVYLDQGSKGFAVEGNVVYAASGGPIRLNQCQESWHSWKGNSFGPGPGAAGFPADAAAKAGPEEPYKGRSPEDGQ